MTVRLGIALVGLAVATSQAAAIPSVTLHAGEWQTTTRADVLAHLAPLRTLIQALDSGPGSVAVIRHATSTGDRDRAEALRSALVAMGVPSARIVMEPASAEPAVLIVELRSIAGERP